MSTTKEPKAAIPLIHLALAAIIQDIAAIGKNQKNTAQNFTFRGIDDFYNNLHPIFSAHGVVCLPSVENVEEKTWKNSKGNDVFGSTVTVTYRFTAKDGSFTEAKCVGSGFDFADKSIPKALSAAQKYLLIQTFLIPTTDVADADYESTVYPAAEIKEQEEAERVAKELERQNAKLEEKREKTRQQVEASGGLPPGATAVEPAAAPADRPKRAKKTSPAPEEQPPTEQPDLPIAETPKPKAGAPAWEAHVITAINHKKYSNRTVGDLSVEEIQYLEEKWYKPNADAVASTPAKLELWNHLKAALAARLAEAKK